MGKRRHSEEKEYADREDELHDPDGRSTRLTTYTRTPRDTDDPAQKSIVGKPPRLHLHPRRALPLPKYPPSIPVVRPTESTPPPPASTKAAKGEKVELETQGLSNTQKKKKARKLKSAEREEKKNSHITGANLPNKSQQPPVVSTLPTAQTSNLVPSSPSEKVGGATLTRLKPKDREQLVEQDRALYVVLPRGEKSVGAAAALAQALLVRFYKAQDTD